MDDIKSRLAGGILWLALARALVNLIAFGSTIVLARLLAPSDFGLVAIATTILAIVTAVTELSLAQALVHHDDPSDDHFHTAWSLNFARGLAVGALFNAAAYPVALLYDDMRLVPIMIVLGLSFVVNGGSNPKMVIFAKSLVFKQDFVTNVLQKLVGVSASICVAVIYQTYWALVVGVVAQQATMVAISYWYVPYRPKVSLKYARDLWSFSIWLSLGQTINTINWKFDQLLVGAVLGKTSLGYYTVGDNLAALPTREATAPLARTLFPAFTWMRDDLPRLRHAYRSAQVTVSAVALPVAVGCALVAAPLIELTMGKKWLPAVPIIQVLSCVFGLQTLSSAVQPLAMSLGETRLLFKRDTLNFVLRLPTIIAGIYFGGLQGLIVARAVTGSLSIVINMHLVRSLIHLPISVQIGANARTLLSTGIMVVAVLVVEKVFGRPQASVAMLLHLGLLVGSGFLAYCLSSILSWMAAGYPPGIESESLRVANTIGRRLKSRL